MQQRPLPLSNIQSPIDTATPNTPPTSSPLFPKESSHPSQNAVLLGVVRVVLARDLEQRREGGRVRIDAVTDALRDLHTAISYQLSFHPRPLTAGPRATYVLVDQQDADVLPLRGEALKGLLNRGVVRLAVHDEEVLLRVRRVGDVLHCAISFFLLPFSSSCSGTLHGERCGRFILRFLPVAAQ